MLTTCSDIWYSIKNSGIIALVQSYPNIQTLTLYNVIVSDDVITAIATHCTKLKSLSISFDYSTLTYKSLITLIKYSTKLEKLRIPWIPIPSAEIAAQCAHALSCIQTITATTDITYCLPYMTLLTTIYLTNCTDITLIEIAQYCHTITLISIKNSALLTNTGLIALSENCRNLDNFYAEIVVKSPIEV